MPAYSGEYEDVLRPFLDAMRYKLTTNRHKGRKWEDNSLEWLLDRIEDEVEELREAIERGNTIEIMLEAADVANFACMVSHLAVKAAIAGKSSDDKRAPESPREAPRSLVPEPLTDVAQDRVAVAEGPLLVSEIDDRPMPPVYPERMRARRRVPRFEEDNEPL